MTIVKLCGFRDVDTIRALHDLDADLVGFILAPSRRQVSAEQLAILIEHVPTWMKTVGVFVNPVLEQLDQLFTLVKLDVVQLHGTETPEFCAQVKQRYNVQVMKVMHMHDGDVQLDDAFANVIDMLLLDTMDGQAAGGTGKAFRWDRIPPVQAWCKKHAIPLLVAGGVTEHNVEELLGWRPDGIDLSSGIETDGVKDPKRMQLFMKRVRAYGNSTE